MLVAFEHMFVPVIAFAITAGAGLRDHGGSAPRQAVDSLMTMVLRLHPGLGYLRSRVSAAEAQVGAAARTEPAVLAFEVEEVPDGVQLWGAEQARLAVEGPIFQSGRRTARRQAASDEATTARAFLSAAERLVTAQVNSRVVAWLASAASAHQLAVEDSVLVETEATIASRLATGASSFVEVLRVRAERLRVRHERVAMLSAAEEHRLAIIGWTYADTTAALMVSRMLDTLAARAPSRFTPEALPAPPPIESLVATAPAAAIAAAFTRQGASLRQAVRAEQRTALGGSLGIQSFRGPLDARAIGATFGLRISLPFTARTQNRTATLAADLDAHSLDARGMDLLASTTRELNMLRGRYAAERGRAELYRTAIVADLGAEREAALTAYRDGSLSLFELLDFERALVRAEIDRIASVRDAWLTWHRMNAAVPAALADELGVGDTQ